MIFTVQYSIVIFTNKINYFATSTDALTIREIGIIFFSWNGADPYPDLCP